ncbi:hypothetical protein MUJ63_04420 [Lachnospiraceae bacterium NSJ-143]|nr:hypothetical protein [Lachnospiraceae bacterium NSJ-143]
MAVKSQSEFISAKGRIGIGTKALIIKLLNAFAKSIWSNGKSAIITLYPIAH